MILILLQACTPCHDYEAGLYARPEGLLEVAAPDDLEEPEARLTLLVHGPDDVRSLDPDLTWVDGGFTLWDPPEELATWLGPGDEVHADEMVLTFGLEAREDLGEFPPIEVPGEAPEAVLWGGWTLDLRWTVPSKSCK